MDSTLGNIMTPPSQDSPAATQPAKPPRAPKPADKRGWWWGTGRRKTAVARARLRPTKGEGSVVVEKKDKTTTTIEKYFPEERDRGDAIAALTLTKTQGRFDIVVKFSGGGLMGQGHAVVHEQGSGQCCSQSGEVVRHSKLICGQRNP